MTALTATPVSIDFHGARIPTFNVEGVIRVAMKPICDAIGLQWEAQFKRIKRHPVLSTCMSMMDIQLPGQQQRRRFITLPLNKLNGWLFGIDTSRVKPAARERLVEYQAECFEVLNDYWQHGGAENPRFTTIDDRKPLNRAVRTLANLRSAQGESADYAGMWKLVNGYLGLAHIEDATPAQVDRAMVFVQESIERETQKIIEGDYLARQALPVEPQPPAQPAIHYPMSAWPEINQQLAHDWANDLPTAYPNRHWVKARHLHGESAPSPTLRLLGQLKNAGFDVSCCEAEVLAMRHHIGQADSTRQEVERLMARTHSLPVTA
ncbi:phage antirepressor N-terminal domain-containing protein [Vreelandella malpeensis]|uniref:Phage antirepressor N-terminal domain-containing protein n=2 Tax=Vreelandella malpeensis TaxID=1172368 RepID=A0ABS8DUC0_9GAMM|nr:phage antirepressor N-terminal domain-containing protein [Halomonas malpeensis]MCB8889927.1 phage antirepressor N-terminal domain-containing protein [Halomonas malpeensis]